MTSAPWLRAGLALGAGVGAGLLAAGRPRAALLALGAAHATFCATAAVPNHAVTGPLVRRFRPRGRQVWLTLDDGPDPRATPEILDVLARHGARATFFLVGERAARHPRLAREVVAAGNSVGNHSHSHPAASFWTAGPRRVAAEIDRANLAIASATGRDAPAYFRPPVGMANVFVEPALRVRGMRRIGWSARAFDTRRQDPVAMVDRLVAAAAPGAIFLLHERGATAGPAILDRFLTRLAVLGFEAIVPADDQLRVDSML